MIKDIRTISEDAISSFDRSFVINPNDADDYYNKGYALLLYTKIKIHPGMRGSDGNVDKYDELYAACLCSKFK